VLRADDSVDRTPGYGDLAEEYYEPRHVTCRNFEAATASWTAEHHSRIPNSGLVLDIGSGRGSAGMFCGVEAGRIVQADIAISMLTVSPRAASKGRVACSALSLPFGSGSFAAVTAFLFDPFNRIEFVAESFRVLTRGGVFLGTLPHYQWGVTLRQLRGTEPHIARFITRSGECLDKPSYLVSERELRNRFTINGCRNVDVYALTLPRRELTVSPDISDPAQAIGVSPYALPVLHLVLARKT